MPKLSDWSPEAEELLRQLWADTALSATQIGQRMRRSRGSVLGKADRLGLPSRGNPVAVAAWRNARQARAARMATTAPAAPERPVAEEAPRREAQRAAPWARSHEPIHYPAELTCQWISGDPRTDGWAFCGADRVPHRPYCEAHCRRAFNPRDVKGGEPAVA